MDPFTELHYFHARWYESVVGRFVGRDLPKRSRYGQRLVGRHPYRYAKNLPTLYVDYNGRAEVYRCYRDIQNSPILSAFGQHCFIRLVDDDGTQWNCGVNPEDGNPQPEPEDLSELDVKCELLGVVSYECVRKALNNQERNRDQGKGTPGFGGKYNPIWNNCCHGVAETLNRCLGPNGERLDTPGDCSDCEYEEGGPGVVGPPTPPCRRQPEDPDPNEPAPGWS